MNKECVPIEEAKNEIAITSRRIALLHLAYAEEIINELGEEKGMKLIQKAIKNYGIKIGEKTKEEVVNMKLPLTPENFDLGRYYGVPLYGMHDKVEEKKVNDETHLFAYGCVLAKTWHEQKADKLGRLYCYVDVAKYMAYNPDYKLVHLKTIPDGDNFCEFIIKPTTEQEKKDFKDRNKDWFYIDK
ncbi:MAG: L-2-amino-thiazoline-4-carboxylic acid hydrolase [Caldisphaera sp.]